MSGLADGVDLYALISRDTELKKVASTRGGEYAGPCPRCGGKDRFRVQPAEGKWFCRGCQPDPTHWGDAIDYVRWRDGVDMPTACRTLGLNSSAPKYSRGSNSHGSNSRGSTPRPTLAADPEEPSEAWRRRAEQLVAKAEETLWTDAGLRAREYLAGRGLSDDTVRRWHLGYLPADAREEASLWGESEASEPVWISRGIVIPWRLEGQLWQLKIRRPTGSEPKYVNVRGGHPSIFGGDDLDGRRVVVLTEGELDAVLLWQEANDLVGVASLGAAGAKLSPLTVSYLLGAETVVAFYDPDKAGADGALALSRSLARAHSIVTQGGDLTDLYQSGVDLRVWLIDQFGSVRVGGGSVPKASDPEVVEPARPSDPTPPAPTPLPQTWRGVEPRWGRERGDMAIRDPLTGEYHEISKQASPRSWRDELSERRRPEGAAS